jgi:hypothetical protein
MDVMITGGGYARDTFIIQGKHHCDPIDPKENKKTYFPT